MMVLTGFIIFDIVNEIVKLDSQTNLLNQSNKMHFKENHHKRGKGD